MGRIIARIDNYKIVETRRWYVVADCNGEYENHSHMGKNLDKCKTLISLVQQRKIPQNTYMLEAARRLTTDPKFKATIEEIQSNKANKVRYIRKHKKKVKYEHR